MPSSLLLGAIADDFTGAADLASMLASAGIRTVLCLDPEGLSTTEDLGFQAAVVALKIRSAPKNDACRQALAVLSRLQNLGVERIYFKYCSTFDSSIEGNIGPVAEALMDAIPAPFTVAVPALPVNGRTQYGGYLFVNDVLLSESHMRRHPIHPMTDSNLVRHLQAQTSKRVGLVPHRIVRAGSKSIREHTRGLRKQAVEIALVDATSDEDLIEIAKSVVDFPLLTGGSGLGMALAYVWQQMEMVLRSASLPSRSPPGGGVLMLSGSCSDASLEQIAEFETSHDGIIQMDVSRLLANPTSEVERLYHEIDSSLSGRGWALAYSSAGAAQRQRVLDAAAERGITAETVSESIESAHRELARRSAADRLARHIVVAGGETSGAVVQGLQLHALEIEDVVDPGVPVMRSVDGSALTLTLKSGNFGSPDFFSKVLDRLGTAHTESRS